MNLPTGPGNGFPEVSYEAWVKVWSYSSRSWVMAQSGCWGAARALTLNDERVGHVGMITGPTAGNAGHSRPPVGRWVHVVGVWRQGGRSTVALNGVSGLAAGFTNNTVACGTGNHTLIIGGSSLSGGAYTSHVAVAEVRVWRGALTASQVSARFKAGRYGPAVTTPGSSIQCHWVLPGSVWLQLATRSIVRGGSSRASIRF